MNRESRNQALAQANQVLTTRVEDGDKSIVALQRENADLRSEKITRQKFTDRLTLQNKKATIKLASLKRTKNLHAFISQVNQHIFRVNDEGKLFQNACRIAIKFGKFQIAWIGLFKEDNRLIDIAEQIGMPEEDIQYFENLPLLKNGPHDQLLRTGQPIVYNDMSVDPQFDRWKSVFDKKGIRSYMILPIRKSGQIIGTFNLYASELNYFKKEELALLNEVTGDISFALNIFEKDKKQQVAEQLVIANEKRHRLLIEKSTDMKLLITGKREIMYSSPAIKSGLGYAKDELLNCPVSQIVSAEDQSLFKRFLNKVMGHPGKSFHFQIQLLHANGSMVWCEGMLTNMLKEPGLNSLIANFRNISEKKEAEQQREFDKNNLNALINNTSDLMWSLDRNFNLTTANVSFDAMTTAMSGRKIEKGSTILSAGFTAEQLSRYKGYYNRVFAGESFTETEYTAAPYEFWSYISYSPIFKNREIIGAACHAHDITEIKLAERKLVQSESRLKEAQAIAHMGNFEIDLRSKTEIWSDEMYNLYGINKEEVVASSDLYYSFLHPDDLATVKGIYDKLFSSFLNGSLEYRFLRVNGELRYGCSEIKFEFDEDHNPIRFYGVMQDITERKLAEKESLKMINDIMLRNSDLEQFGYIISHNLRAPVANIIGASNALQDEDLTTADKLMLNQGITTSIMRLDDVVQDLNQILQVKSNIEETREMVVFSELVEDIKQSIASLISNSSFEITFDFSAINEFLTPKAYLYSIFYNLISNSIKYRKQDIKTLITIVSIKQPGTFLLLFKDNGMGIDLAKSGDDVFGLYKRFHPLIEGKGMGLFMVKTQVETLGGKIRIQSKVDEGTEFTIEFPLMAT